MAVDLLRPLRKPGPSKAARAGWLSLVKVQEVGVWVCEISCSSFGRSLEVGTCFAG